MLQRASFNRAGLASGLASGLTMAIVACHAASAPPSAASAPEDAASTSETGCMPGGNGYLRARARGALELDLDWKDTEIECEGGPRPSGKGIRVVIGGPARDDGHRIRFVFGIDRLIAGENGENLRTNVTVLFEGEKRIFATRGDDKCTVDALTQEPIGTVGASVSSYRVVARGFCLGPATSFSQGERLFLTSFDFAGRVDFEAEDLAGAP